MSVHEAIAILTALAEATHRLAERLGAGEASVRDLEVFLAKRRATIDRLPETASDPESSERLERAVLELLAADRRIARWCARRRLALRKALSGTTQRPPQSIVSDEA